MIYEILKAHKARGPEQAITTGELMERTGLDLRELRRVIQKERRRHIICGKTYGSGGYYRPACREDITAYRKLFEKRIQEFSETLELPRRMTKRGKRV